MNTPSVQAALDQVQDEMSRMSPQELDAHKPIPEGTKWVTVEQLQELAAAAYNMAAAKGQYYASNSCSVGYNTHKKEYYEAARAFDQLISTILQQE